METTLTENLSSDQLNNISAFAKKYDYRVLMWRNTASDIKVDGVTGWYNASGIYSLLSKVWVKKIIFDQSSSATYPLHRVQYQDANLNMITCGEVFDDSAGATNIEIELEYPVFTDYLKIGSYNKITDEFTAVQNPEVYNDTYFDITRYIESITYQQNASPFSNEFTIPYTVLSIANIDGVWNKNRSLTLDYNHWRRAIADWDIRNIGSQDVKEFKTRGTRFTVEVKFLGEDFAVSEYILLSTFYARKFTNNAISGESGWVAKIKEESPLLENITVWDLLGDYVSKRNNGSVVLQVNKERNDEIINVVNEYVGETLFDTEPTNRMLEGKQVLSHCSDGTYFYYAIRDLSGVWYERGASVKIYRYRIGEEPELLGYVRPVYPRDYTWGGGIIGSMTTTYLMSCQRFMDGSQPFHSYVAHVTQMAVDDQFLYIPTLCVSFIEIDPVVGDGIQRVILSPIIFRLWKQGGWDHIMPEESIKRRFSGLGNVNAEAPGYTTEWTNSYAWGLGFKFWSNGLDVEDPFETGNSLKMFLGCAIDRDENNNKKLLVTVKEKDLSDTGSSPMTKYYYIDDSDWGTTWTAVTSPTRTQIGESGNLELVLGIQRSNNDLLYALVRNFGIGADQLAVVDQIDDGSYVVSSYGRSIMNYMSLALSSEHDGLYVSGRGYITGDERYLSSFTDPYGIMLIYKTMFNLQGYNIIHVSDEDRNEFIQTPIPDVRVDGENLDDSIIRYTSMRYRKSILTTSFYSLNTLNGEISLRAVFPNGSVITANYDYINSVGFFKADGKQHKLSNEIVGKLQQVTDGTLWINEYGALERLPFINQKMISFRGFLADYYTTFSENPDTNPEEELPFAVTAPSVLLDSVTGMQFISTDSGTLKKIRFPLRAFRASGYSGSLPDLDIELFLANDNDVQISCTRDAVTPGKPAIPPVTAQITSLGTFTVKANASFLKEVDGGEATEFTWEEFDVSAAGEEIAANIKYVIIVRQKTGISFGYRWESLCKAAAEENGNPLAFHNKLIYLQLSGGAAMSTILSTDWNVSTTYDVFPLNEIIFEKDSVNLSSDVIDSLNPNISTGYSSLMGGSDTTIIVTNDDFTKEYVRNTDYSITRLAGGMFQIEPLALTLDDYCVVRWATSPSELITIIDRTKHGDTPILIESSEHGDENMFETFRVQGERLRPSDLPMTVNKKFDMYPGVDQNAQDEIKHSKNVEVINTLDWDDAELKFKEAGTPVDTSSFAVEFKDPIILGTTAYLSREAKWESGSKIVAGTLSSAGQSVPKFYEVDVSSASFESNNYHVMFKQEQYRAWRIATVNDYSDMLLSGVVVGDPPTGLSDIKTESHFYVKHMNSRNRSELGSCNYVAYESEYILYFKNQNGTIIKDSTFTSGDERNPINSSYLDLSANILVSAEDLFGLPLFPYHSESGNDGYSSDADSDIKMWMSAKVQRVDISNLGLSAIYDNYDEDTKKFLRVTVSGYPINNVLNIVSEVNSGNLNHADAKEYTIKNSLLQNQPVIDLRVRGLAAFWKYDRLNYKSSSVYHPMLRPGAIIKVISERENLNNALFAVFNPKHTLSRESMITSFGSLLQL